MEISSIMRSHYIGHLSARIGKLLLYQVAHARFTDYMMHYDRVFPMYGVKHLPGVPPERTGGQPSMGIVYYLVARYCYEKYPEQVVPVRFGA
jgi:hypothetical protein